MYVSYFLLARGIADQGVGGLFLSFYNRGGGLADHRRISLFFLNFYKNLVRILQNKVAENRGEIKFTGRY